MLRRRVMMVQKGGHEYVEIGGIKWATMNLGAESVTDVGLYFQWADTQGYTADQVGSGTGQHYFNDDNCKYFDWDWDGFIKYNNIDNKTVLDLEDDAVNAAWGGNWRMPTSAEITTLINATNRTWTNDYNGSGIAGLVCTDKTDSSKILFFPASGYATRDYIQSSRNYSYVQTSSLYSYNSCYCMIASNSSNGVSQSNRSGGLPIRGILDE